MVSVEENIEVLIEAWKLMVGRMPGATLEHADGLATMFAHIPLPFLNISAPDGPLMDAEQFRATLAVARRKAAECAHGSLLALSPAWVPEDWERIAAEAGFTFTMNMTGMEAHRLLPPRRSLPELAFRRVTDETTARDIAMVNAHAYGMPADLFECICNLHLWHPDTFGYVAYADGKAVSATAAFPVQNILYVAFVATLPEAHGRGYAETVMRHAIEQSQSTMGGRKMTLHASDMGEPLYRSMGFTSGSKVVLLGNSTDAAH